MRNDMLRMVVNCSRTSGENSSGCMQQQFGIAKHRSQSIV